MKLSERKKKILQIVVDDYISTAVPVSSKSITERYLPSISSATIRSELSALEELGYLSQLHVSSGRVPSADAYKLYVSELMTREKLSAKELNYIKKIFCESGDNMDYVIKNVVKVVSELTDYTSVAVATHDVNEKIEAIKIFRVTKDKAILVIITERKLIKDNLISIPEDMTDEQVASASEMMNKLLANKKLGEVFNAYETFAKDFNEYRELFIKVVDALKAYVGANDNEVLLEGEEKIFRHQEYTDTEKVKDILSVVTSKDKMMKLFSDENNGMEINVKLGSDGYEDIPEDCSVVTATYYSEGVKLGTYGVIGPSRMDYQKVVAVLENVGKILDNILSKKGK